MIDVGQTLDKYELLERVGQGGMAVVYRGIDTSLKRTVAVKVLHHHLAEHEEARNRFEREAQAVAKLRHENILEIFDFSGTESNESYIVTEFIDGQTLKEFTTDHQIEYPEVGAMITAQVCRALSHAHGLGVLHRDVKPENIMIRNDGVVKLMDFGIAQMLDTHRLTVTGQLLGSPAYMSPEHVAGKRLDVRTDVFSVGILLYQLVTGELPFKGRNPHEILKRIAECKFIDARVVNPLVGNELGNIINNALAREKDDRYGDVGLMLADLEKFLESSKLGDYQDELRRFFESPVQYELALRPRLVAALTTRGRALLEDGNKAPALDVFNRVLTIEPDNAEVLAEIDRMSRRRRWMRIGVVVAGVAAVGGLALVANETLRRRAAHQDGPLALALRADAGAGPGAGMAAAVATADAAPAVAPPVDPPASDEPADAGTPAVAVRGDGDDGPGGDRGDRTDGRPRDRLRVSPDRPRHRERADAGAPTPAETDVQRTFSVYIYPLEGSEYKIDNKDWKPYTGDWFEVTVGSGEHTIYARNDACCQENSVGIDATETGGRKRITMPFRPATVTLLCDAHQGVGVSLDKEPKRLGVREQVFMNDEPETEVEVSFFVSDGGDVRVIDAQTVILRAGQPKIIRCAP